MLVDIGMKFYAVPSIPTCLTLRSRAWVIDLNGFKQSTSQMTYDALQQLLFMNCKMPDLPYCILVSCVETNTHRTGFMSVVINPKI